MLPWRGCYARASNLYDAKRCLMLSYARLQPSPRALRTFTGLDKDEFDTLCVPFAHAWHTYVSALQRPEHVRKRRLGGGRKARLLSVQDKLLFIRFSFKIYPLQEVLAFWFDMSQGRANEWIHKLSTVLQLALGDPRCLPARHPQDLEQVLALCVSVDVIIDGTERRTQRPTEAAKQKTH
jgi:Helix-turn-helix of DDE superfamily endonuclease